MHVQAAQLPMRKCASPRRLKGSTRCQQLIHPLQLAGSFLSRKRRLVERAQSR